MKTAWIDINTREYKLCNITDSHLLNILNFITRGGGYDSFMSVEVIERLYNEAIKRELKPHYSLNRTLLGRFGVPNEYQ